MKKLGMMGVMGMVVLCGAVSCLGAAAEEETPKHIEELFGDELTDAEQEEQPLSRLAGKKVGVYFSAHWCPPCRTFTPKLVKAYNEMQEKGYDFELVFVSSDRSEDDMYKYMEETNMPWLAVPHGSKTAAKLKERFGIRGIPTLVILDEEGEKVTQNGRRDVSVSGADAYEKW